MPLTAGNKLGPYEIVAPIGAGGMGEVYRARDTKLNRDVALKVLPEAFAADPERLSRFEREAQALAALNHPNIAQIHGLEGLAIVMELVEGRDLSEITDGGQGLQLTDALPIARQIAAALETAHGAGIIHRDLKPANVKVRDDGTVKVLDFGLAKMFDADGGAGLSASLANSPTLTARATELGMVLGTAAYMAPEQAKGRAVDRRADVWAFGIVLYEMLTGRRAFRGDDVTEVLAAVLRDTPDMSALPPGTPESIRRLLRRCLEKDPRKRLRDMGDVGLELDEAMAGSSPEAGSGAGVVAGPSRSPALVLAGAAALVAIASLATWWLKPVPPVDRAVTRFSVTLDEGQSLLGLTNPSIALSDDGRRLAFRASGVIFVRDLDQLEAREVIRVQGTGLWFSPDGEWLLYGTLSGLSKIRTSGGPSQDLVDVGAFGAVGADWGDEGMIVYSTGQSVSVVPEAGGTPRLVAESQSGALYPELLPGSQAVLYTLFEGQAGGGAAAIAPLNGGETQVVLGGVRGARYVETGHLVYGLEDRLVAVPFDLASRTVTGEPVPMPERVFVSSQTGWAQAVLSPNGTLAYFTRALQSSLQLVWVDAKGGATPAVTTPRHYSDVRLAPDGRRAAVHLWDEDDDVWIADLVRGGLTRITFTSQEEETPVWSPDGRDVAYTATREAQPPRVLLRKRADGSTAAVEEQIWQSPDHFHVNDWSPDGRTILVEVRRTSSFNDVIAIDVSTGAETPLLTSAYSEAQARFSPDGKWLVYVSDESGRAEVYAQPYPSLDARVSVSTEGGVEPVWSRDGRRLYFRSTDSIMAADVTSASPLEFSAPRALFADRYTRTQGAGHTHFDVASDGRLLFIEDPTQTGAAERERIHLVLNWTEELKRLVPVK